MEVVCPKCGHRWWDGGGEENKIYQCPKCGQIFALKGTKFLIPLLVYA